MKTGILVCVAWSVVGCGRTSDGVETDGGAVDAAADGAAAPACPVEGAPVVIGREATGLSLDYDGQAPERWQGQALVVSPEGDTRRLVGDGLDIQLTLPRIASPWLPPGLPVWVDLQVANLDLAYSFAIAIRLTPDGPPVIAGLAGEGDAVLDQAAAVLGPAGFGVALGEPACPAHPHDCWARVQDRPVRVTLGDGAADPPIGGEAAFDAGADRYTVLLGESSWSEGDRPGVSCADEPRSWLDLVVYREPRDGASECLDCATCRCADGAYFGAGACFYAEADPVGLCHVDYRPDGVDYDAPAGCAQVCASHGGPSR